MEQVKINKYLDYLLEKLYIFKPNVKLDISNSIDETYEFEEIIQKIIDNSKLKGDVFMQELTKDILINFSCFEVIDYELKNRITEDDISLYDMYKKYKENKNGIRPCDFEQDDCDFEQDDCCNNNLYLDISVDTNGQDIEYINSLDFISTNSLVKAFGEYLFTGNHDPTLSHHRYEYKFIYQGYIYSIYDYLDENNSWYSNDDIYWHVATNCRDNIINESFIKKIELATK